MLDHNYAIGQWLQVHYRHDYELCIVHYALIKKSIDLWAGDTTAFTALYSPRQRWRSYNSCYENPHLSIYQELHRSVNRRTDAALFFTSWDAEASVGFEDFPVASEVGSDTAEKSLILKFFQVVLDSIFCNRGD